MEPQSTARVYYALLIGIDAYPERPLKSCVQDVQELRRLIESHISNADIQVFTTREGNTSKPSPPSEKASHWPSYRVVARGLERITSLGKAGDCVFIHFSGHGTRCHRPPGNGPDEFSNTHTGDVALVLLHDGPEGIKYLSSAILALSLKAMADKGMIVTLVLDCCFSAAL